MTDAGQVARKTSRYPQAEAARLLVRNAVRTGKLVKPALCEKCGLPGRRGLDGRSLIQAHHHRGYAYPIEVQWLCSQCHIWAHFEARQKRFEKQQLIRCQRDKRTCKECGTEYHRPINVRPFQWRAKHNFCSRRCRYANQAKGMMVMEGAA